MMLLSEAKVASMWESKGEAARRRRGCVGARAVDFEGEEAEGEAAMKLIRCLPRTAWTISTYIYRSSLQARR